MKKKFALTLILIGVAMLLMAMMPDEGEACPDAQAQGLGGEWLWDERYQECWYLHSVEEFEVPMEGCNVCHDNAFYGKTWMCPWKTGDA